MELPLNDFYGLPLTVFKRNRIQDGSSKEFRESWLDFFFIGFGTQADHRTFILQRIIGLGFSRIRTLVFQESGF